MNKKIQNATKKEYDGIQFKSLLEISTYKILKELGLNPSYEKETFLIWEGCNSKVPFFTKNSFKRKNHNIEVLSHNTVIDRRPLTGITYTPDITFDYKGKHIIIECKGFTNDVFPYKFKMFRKYIQELNDGIEYEIWEIFTKKQLIECINHLETLPSL